ncbi:MAG: class I SAM-dependent methyltransferase [Pseudomonadota bacterium]
MPDPTSAAFEWKARLNGFLERNGSEHERAVNASKRVASDALACERLRNLADALRQQRDAICRRLGPLALDTLDFANEPSPTARLTNKLPAAQGLLSYADNVYRDWAWENGENEQLVAIVNQLLESAAIRSIKRAVTLGAGAARLPYDLHRRWQPEQSIVVDFNPWLLLTGLATIAGEKIELPEIPLAPLTLADTARTQTLCAPEPLDVAASNAMQFVLADVTRPPIAPGSCDVVMTPWLIDIVSEDLPIFARRLNSMLEPDGLWVNSGSLAFMPHDPLRAYSADEALAIVADAGFDVLEWRRDTVPYLNSPLSAHGRYETLLSFVARKRATVAVPAPQHVLPEWLIDLSLPIPADAADTFESARYLLKAQILGAADGTRSVRTLGEHVAAHYGLTVSEATHVVRRVLAEHVDRTQPTRLGGAV